MRKNLIILCLSLLGCISVYAQEIITGTVLDSKNEPIPGVRVEVIGRSEVTTTDIEGRFRLDLPVAVKKLRFSYIGRKPIERKVKPEMIVKMGSGWQGRDSGYRGFFNFMGGVGTGGVMNFYFQNKSLTDVGKSSAMFGISMTHGYQINPMFYVGLGAGVAPLLLYYNDINPDGYMGWSEFGLYGIACQFYADFRWDYDIKAKTAPFVDLKIGLQRIFETGEMDDDYGYSYNNDWRFESLNTTGFLLMPTIGLRTAIGSKNAMNIGLSYNMFVKRAFNAWSTSTINLPNGEAFSNSFKAQKCQKTGGVAMLNIGFDF